jgi:hypothetical protein
MFTSDKGDDRCMPMPELTVIALGTGPGGERWYLKGGGSAADCYTFLETVHPDGHRDEGGMGGPVRYPGQLLNVYTGQADRGPLRVIVRADPRVRRLRCRPPAGQWHDLLPVAADAELGVTYFAALLPGTASLDYLQALDADGRPLES